MKTNLTLEEMVVNLILNDGKKFTREDWLDDEYIVWYRGMDAHGIRDEEGIWISLISLNMLLDDWREWKG